VDCWPAKAGEVEEEVSIMGLWRLPLPYIVEMTKSAAARDAMKDGFRFKADHYCKIKPS
jgi:hypothetical protein